MAAVTVLNRLEVNSPTVEVVVIEATDNETYTSKKFGKILAANLTPNEYVVDLVNTTFECGGDGTGTARLRRGTAGVNAATDYTCTLTLYGRK